MNSSNIHLDVSSNPKASIVQNLNKAYDLAITAKVHAAEGRFAVSAYYLNEANKAILCDFYRMVWGIECKDPLATQLYLITQLPYGIRIKLGNTNDMVAKSIKFTYDRFFTPKLNKTISKYAKIETRFKIYVQDGTIIVRCIGDEFKRAIDKLSSILSQELINNLRKNRVNKKYLETLLKILKRANFKAKEIDKLLRRTNKLIKLSGSIMLIFFEIMNISNSVMSLFIGLASGGMGKVLSKGNDIQNFVIRMFSLYTFSMFYQFISESMMASDVYNSEHIKTLYIDIINYYIKNLNEALESIK